MSEAQTKEAAAAAAAAGGDGPAPDEIAKAVEAAKAAARFQDAADSLKLKASLVWDPAEREKLVTQAYAKEKEAHGESKKARIIASGWGQGAGLGAGISAGVGMGIGNVLGALVGGVVAVPGTLIGTGVGALHGPFYKLKNSITGGGGDQAQAVSEDIQGKGFDSESEEDVKTHVAVVEAARKLEQEGKDGAGDEEQKSAETAEPPAGSAAPQVQEQESKPANEAADAASQGEEEGSGKQQKSAETAEPPAGPVEPQAKKQEIQPASEAADASSQVKQEIPAAEDQGSQPRAEPANDASQVEQGETPAQNQQPITLQDNSQGQGSQPEVEPANTASPVEQGKPPVQKQPETAKDDQENTTEPREPQAEKAVESVQEPVDKSQVAPVESAEVKGSQSEAGGVPVQKQEGTPTVDHAKTAESQGLPSQTGGLKPEHLAYIPTAVDGAKSLGIIGSKEDQKQVDPSDASVQNQADTPTVDQAKAAEAQGLPSQTGGLKLEHLAYIPKAIDGAKSLGIIGSKGQKREDLPDTSVQAQEEKPDADQGKPSETSELGTEKQSQKSKGGWFFGKSADKANDAEAEEPTDKKIPEDHSEDGVPKTEESEAEESKGGWLFGKSAKKAEKPKPEESSAEDLGDKEQAQDQKEVDEPKIDQTKAEKSKGGWLFGKKNDNPGQPKIDRAEAKETSEETTAEAGGA